MWQLYPSKWTHRYVTMQIKKLSQSICCLPQKLPHVDAPSNIEFRGPPNENTSPIHISLHQFTSIYINLHQFTSIYINLHQFTSIYINLHQFTSIYPLYQNTSFIFFHFRTQRRPWAQVFPPLNHHSTTSQTIAGASGSSVVGKGVT